MRRKTADKIKFFFAVVYSLFVLPFRKKPKGVIIYYHSIKDNEVSNFEKQMAYLAENFDVVKASDIRAEVNSGIKPIVAITFDDAFVSVIKNAVPILREYGLPAGIFVPVDNLEQAPRWENPKSYKDEVVMSKGQIEQLDKQGFEIFSHTLSHSVLTEIEDGRLETELSESKQALERIVNHEVVGISYPHGAYDTRVCNVAQKCGYKLGFTIEPNTVDCKTEYLKIGRFWVSPRDSLFKFKLKVNGAYQVVKFLRALKHWL